MTGGILALDLAERTGWAYAGPVVLASWPRSELEAAAADPPAAVSGWHKLPGTGPDVGRFLVSFHDWLVDIMSIYRPALVVFEAPWVGPNTHQDTARKLMCLAGHAEFVCRRADTEYREANNATVRKHFAGKGRAPRAELKRLTIEACRRRGWEPENDDEADALGLLDYAVACWRPRRRAA